MIDITRLPGDEQIELQQLLEGAYSHLSPFADTWEFLCNAVFTRDEADGSIKRFPANARWKGELRFGYLKLLTYERPKHKICVYDKARRMMITWWAIAVYLDELMRFRNGKAAVASDKLSKSAFLLGPERMQFIYDHIPPVSDERLETLRYLVDDIGPFREQIWPDKPLVKFERKEGEGWTFVKCAATGSSIMAVASGQAQMQQYTFRNVLMDEFSRWENQYQSWRNIQPTLQGGGGADIIFTTELGSFSDDLIFDRAL